MGYILYNSSMVRAAVFLAEGYEEIEFTVIVDVLRRAEVHVDVVSIAGDYRSLPSKKSKKGIIRSWSDVSEKLETLKHESAKTDNLIAAKTKF